jgi:hypothetical protein
MIWRMATEFVGGEMTDQVTLSREQAREIFDAINGGINGILKTLRGQPENLAWMYAIMSNLAVIHINLAGIPRVTSN